MAKYCDPADLYAFGLPRGALPNPGRLVASVSVADDAITLDGHGFESGDPVSFRAEAGGSLPAPLVAGTSYYALPITGDTFSVSATVGGSAVNLTTAGANTLAIAPRPIAAAITWSSRLIDDMLPAHVVPLTEPYHPLVRMTCAELSAGKLLGLQGAASKSLSEMIDAAHKRLARWAKGIPLRGDNVPTAAQKATSATVPYADRRGWNRHGGL